MGATRKRNTIARRTYQVLVLLACGYNQTQISAILHITTRTVYQYYQDIKHVTNSVTMPQAVKNAIQCHFITVDTTEADAYDYPITNTRSKKPII